MNYLILALSAILLPSVVHAQAYKCKDQSGKISISSKPCQDGKKIVSAAAPEYVSPQRQREALMVHRRRQAEVDRIDAQYEAAVRAQQNYHAAKKVEQEEAKIVEEFEKAQKASEEAGRTDLGRKRSDRMSVPRPAPSVITSCDAGGCWDNLGGRYTKGGGSTYFPSSGGSCQMIGGQMQCP